MKVSSVNSGRETAIRNVSIKNTVVGIPIKYGTNSKTYLAYVKGASLFDLIAGYFALLFNMQ